MMALAHGNTQTLTALLPAGHPAPCRAGQCPLLVGPAPLLISSLAQASGSSFPPRASGDQGSTSDRGTHSTDDQPGAIPRETVKWLMHLPPNSARDPESAGTGGIIDCIQPVRGVNNLSPQPPLFHGAAAPPIRPTHLFN
ncbi:hypothetical protein AAFF_G00281550 [Aldrovandia affinis]|uniref:Uncharacterized protein n=1 Tax=Aldrovandia affinis TaxID=143900 RepID=A0AAD7RA76_9TELE|nr:hypothetical protein AAFF_G00281550 [Aldrovandia affinis]